MKEIWNVLVILNLFIVVSTEGLSGCQFPFIYEGVSYSSCTTVDSEGKPWCSTQTDDEHNYIDDAGKWKFCEGCRLWMCDAPDQHALLVHSNKTGLLYPDVVKDSWATASENAGGSVCPRSADHYKAVDIPEGEYVIAACPGPRNRLRDFDKSILSLICHNGQLKDNGREIHWTELGCLHKLRSNTKRRSGGVKCGAQQGYIQSIGWRVDKKFFIPQIDVCFNKEIETTVYTHHLIHGRYIDAKAVDPKPRRPPFTRGELFSVRVNNLYKKKNQKVVLANLLGSPDHLKEFGRAQNYLARGHLSPDADFVTEAEQNATFSYANAVPQWQGFNNGNWKTIEGATRDLAETRELTLSIWTGTHGVLHLHDEQGKPVPIYLGQADKTNIVPVPELMWKVVHSPSENQSLVFIGLNDILEYDDEDFSSNLWNSLTSLWHFGMDALRDSGLLDSIPFVNIGSEIRESSPSNLCQDVCSEIKWVKWKKRKIANKGKVVCCSLQDARKIIPTLPNLDDTTLLL